MKRFFSLWMILVLLLSAAGCTLDGTSNTTTADSEAATGTTEGTQTVPERMVSDLSVIYKGYICEHHFGTDGKLAYTDVRGTDWSYGLLVYQLRYTYDNDGALRRMNAYAIDDDTLDLYMRKYTLYRTVEFEVTETGYAGTVYAYDSRGGGRYANGDTVTAVVENGIVKTVDWSGCTVEFDENGRKISERAGDRYAEFVYDDNGSVTEMKIYDSEGENDCLTVEYGEDGYPDKAWIKNAYDDLEMSFDMDAEGKPTAFHMKDASYDPARITDVEFSYTDDGSISAVSCVEDRGESERFWAHHLTFEAGMPVTHLYEGGRDGVVEDYDEYSYSFGNNGLLTQEQSRNYQLENGEMILRSTETTTFTYDEQGRLVEERRNYAGDSNFEFSDTKTYAYNDDGRVILQEDKGVYSDGYNSHEVTGYEYHPNGETAKYTHIYYDESDQLREKYVYESDENGDDVISFVYHYENGTEVLSTVTRYTILSRVTENGKTTTITEEITYDADDQPLEKWIRKRTVNPFAASGSEGMEWYLYENGEWVQQELW